MYKSIFHERLNSAIRIRNVKQIELAEKTGISRAQISEYISGKCKPKQDKLYLIAVALNVNPMWLMGLDVYMDMEQTDLKKKMLKRVDELNETQLQKLSVILDTLF